MGGLFGSLASGLRRRELKATDAGNLSWAALYGQQNSRAGVSVNVDSALKVSTVFACLRVLADGIAQVPLKVYREKADGSKELAKDHPAYRLLSRRPNDWMTSFEFRQVMMFHAVLLGNGCAYIGRIRGVPRELIPLVPGSYTIEQARDYTLTYRLTGPNGLTTVLPREEVFHLRGPSWTGVAGLDALQVAREAVGLAIATEETHAALHANGTQPGGVLSVKGSLDDAARARLKESWAQYQGGLANRFKTAVLDMDSTWTPLGMKGVDAEHLDTRRFQIEEICRDLKVFQSVDRELGAVAGPRPVPRRGRHFSQIFHAGPAAWRQRSARHLLRQRYHQRLADPQRGAAAGRSEPDRGTGRAAAAPQHEHAGRAPSAAAARRQLTCYVPPGRSS